MKNMTEMYVHLQSKMKDEKGQTMVEYALIIALIAVMLVGGLQLLEGDIAGVFTSIGAAL